MHIFICLLAGLAAGHSEVLFSALCLSRHMSFEKLFGSWTWNCPDSACFVFLRVWSCQPLTMTPALTCESSLYPALRCCLFGAFLPTGTRAPFINSLYPQSPVPCHRLRFCVCLAPQPPSHPAALSLHESQPACQGGLGGWWPPLSWWEWGQAMGTLTSECVARPSPGTSPPME